MKNKRFFGTILVLCLIVIFLIISGLRNNNITGNVVVDLVGEPSGLFAFILAILILVIVIGGYDWMTSSKNN